MIVVYLATLTNIGICGHVSVGTVRPHKNCKKAQKRTIFENFVI